MSRNQSVATLYDDSAPRWVRREPSSLSDFTARPAVFEMCEPVVDGNVLDLGCGEGYCSRELARRGAGSVLGVDLSAQMIAAARDEEAREPLGIEYCVGNAARWSDVPARRFDLACAVFLFNYLTLAEMLNCLRLVHALLQPEGRFVFSVPHPCFPFMRGARAPFYFDADGVDYFRDRDVELAGEIWKRDGVPLPVRAVHKTFGDYFEALAQSGFRAVAEVRELGVTDDMVAQDPAFFGPLAGVPLHLAFSVRR